MARLKQKLYVNADRSALAEEGSAEAAYLLAGEGGEVSDEDVEKYGLKKKDLMDETDAAEGKSVEAAPEDKALKSAPENKSSKKASKKSAK